MPPCKAEKHRYQERYSSKFQTRVPLLPWKNFLACIPLQLHVTIPNSEEVWERKSYDMPPWKAENHRYQRLSPLSSCQEAWQCPGAEERAKNSPSWTEGTDRKNVSSTLGGAWAPAALKACLHNDILLPTRQIWEALPISWLRQMQIPTKTEQRQYGPTLTGH